MRKIHTKISVGTDVDTSTTLSAGVRANRIFKHIMLLAILLSLAGKLASCEKGDNGIDPTKTILGKWELVATQIDDEKPKSLQASGYYEFRSDSIAVWYDHGIKIPAITIKYWLFASENRLLIHFHLESNSIYMKKEGLFTHGGFFCVFFSKNRMGLQFSDPGDPRLITFIYERIK